MSDYPMLISNKLHSFRNFVSQISSLGVVSHPEASGYVSNNIKTMKRLIYLVSCLSV